MKRWIWLAAAAVLIFGTAGCGGYGKEQPPGEETAGREETLSQAETGGNSFGPGVLAAGVYTAGDGGFTLKIPGDQWKVEKDDDEDPLFIKNDDENICFSASKWEDMMITEDFDFSGYYESYYGGILVDHPEAERTAYGTVTLDGKPAVYMGVSFLMNGILADIRMYLVPSRSGKDCYCFTLSLEQEKTKRIEDEFRGIVESIRLLGAD